MKFRPTLCDCAGFFKCSEDTISRIIQKEESLTFWDFRERYFGSSRMQLRQKAFQMAMSGDRTMMIFMLKNFCGMKDNPDFDLEPQQCEVEFIDD
ncbi:MAG: hypothetical protein KF681_11385 [Bdellovibrionaceae bacterium]|nr:hypothetical protein [Pseudobdellovibrionaceae bacterium]